MSKITNLDFYKKIKKLKQQQKDLTVLLKIMKQFAELTKNYYMYKGLPELLASMAAQKIIYEAHLSRIAQFLKEYESNKN